MARLGEIFDLQMGKTPARGISDYWEEGTNSWISIADLSSYEKYTGETKEQITDLAVQESGIKAVPPNTVIMSFKLSIGKTAITQESVYTNEAIMAFIPKGNCEIFPDYLFYMLSSKDWSKGTNRAVMGATLNKATLGEINVTVPTLKEQCQIAAVLDKISTLISLRKQQLAKLDELVKARFVEMFGDPATNPNGLRIIPLSEIAEYFNGLTYKPEDVSDTGTIVLRSSNIQNSQLDFSDTVRVDCQIKERLFVKENDILMCSRNGSARLVGKVALMKHLNEPMSFGAFMMIIRSKYYPYLMTYFQTDAFRLQIKTGATTTINQITGHMLDEVQLPVPELDDVTPFKFFIEQVDRQKLTIQQSLDKLEVMKKSLMQEYFG